MTIIEATSVGFKSMADGSLRQTIEYSPIHAQEAFKLYGGIPGAPMGTFRLTPEAAQKSAQNETINEYGKITCEILQGEKIIQTIEADKPKGGALAKLAGMWSCTPSFWDWLNSSGVGINISNEYDAKLAIYEICDIGSRSQLDNYQKSADAFHKYIRIPYGEYLKTL